MSKSIPHHAPTLAALADPLVELGRRLTRRRLARNWSQEHLANEAGVSLSTVKRLEAGGSTQLNTFVAVLRALGLVDNLLLLVPEPQVRPLDALERGQQRRRRASKSRDDATPPPVWGEDERAR